MKSFQILRKFRMPAVTSTGLSSGRITRKNSCRGRQPSMIAASSSSRGMVSNEAVDQEDREGHLQRGVEDDDADLGVDEVGDLHHRGQREEVDRQGDAHDQEEIKEAVEPRPVARHDESRHGRDQRGEDGGRRGVEQAVEEAAGSAFPFRWRSGSSRDASSVGNSMLMVLASGEDLSALMVIR